VNGGLGRIARFLERQPRALITPAAAALTVLVGLLDYLTGPELASLLFYLIPVAVAGGAGRTIDTLAIGVLAGACWFAAETLRGRDYEVEWILLWNALLRMVVFALVGSLIAVARRRPLLPDGQGLRCAYCGSTDTIQLQRNLVCLACRRVFTPDQAEPGG
jgi:hypothetical protein